MRTIRAFRAEHPDVVVRADGLTSLRILDGAARRAARRRHRARARSPTRTGSRRRRWPGCRSTTWPCRRGTGWPAPTSSEAADLDGEPVLVVDRADAPTAHDEIEAYCAAAGARPRWIPHAAIQVERVLDQVALGTGIGWLNSWQAEPAARRFDVAVRPLRPVALFDEFRVVWRAGDTSETTAAFVSTMLETCAT